MGFRYSIAQQQMRGFTLLRSSTATEGFTFVEMVIVVSIVLLAVTLTVPRLLDSFARGAANLRDDARNIVHLLGTAQSNASSNRNNDHWGIRLVDNGTTDCGTSTAKDCMVLYKGRSFGSRDTSFDQVYVLSGTSYWSMLLDNDFYYNRFSGHAMDLYGNPAYPVAYYSFENATSSDFSGNNYHGVLAGPSGDSNCARNNSDCLLFNSSESDYISLLTNMMTVNDINSRGVTYAAWIWTQSSGSEMGAVGQSISPAYDRYYNGGIFIDKNNKINIQSCCQDQTGCTGTNCTTSIWNSAINTSQAYHVAGVFDAANQMQYLYVNGDLKDSDAIPAIATHAALGGNYIGRTASSTKPAYFNGWIDDVWIYDRALSASDVAGLRFYTRPTSTYDVLPLEINIANGLATATVEVFPTGFVRYRKD